MSNLSEILGGNSYSESEMLEKFSTSNFKNKLINGDFRFWQRGTSFNHPESDGFVADRFELVQSGDSLKASASKVSWGNTLALRVDVEQTATVNEYSAINQKIEGGNLATLVDNNFTFSFKIKTNRAGTYYVMFRNSAGTRSYYTPINVLGNESIEYFSVTVINDSSYWDFSCTGSLLVQIILDFRHSSYIGGSSNVWNDGNLWHDGSQVQFFDSESNWIETADWQLESGSFASAFEIRPSSVELELCQRYYEKSYSLDDAPGSITNAGVGEISAPRSLGDGYRIAKESFCVLKRIPPTGYVYSPNNGVINRIYNIPQDDNKIGSISNITEQGFNVRHADVSPRTEDQEQLSWHWTADAEL